MAKVSLQKFAQEHGYALSKGQTAKDLQQQVLSARVSQIKSDKYALLAGAQGEQGIRNAIQGLEGNRANALRNHVSLYANCEPVSLSWIDKAVVSVAYKVGVPRSNFLNTLAQVKDSEAKLVALRARYDAASWRRITARYEAAWGLSLRDEMTEAQRILRDGTSDDTTFYNSVRQMCKYLDDCCDQLQEVCAECTTPRVSTPRVRSNNSVAVKKAPPIGDTLVATRKSIDVALWPK